MPMCCASAFQPPPLNAMPVGSPLQPAPGHSKKLASENRSLTSVATGGRASFTTLG